jgi:metal-sulfur cluster biosynthetic enzyme
MNNNVKILQVLKRVIDPEIGLNIVDLGLVYNIEETENSILVTMTLTTPGCPMHNSITQWVENSIKQFAPSKIINVNLVWEPKWTPERMTEEAKNQLGM